MLKVGRSNLQMRICYIQVVLAVSGLAADLKVVKSPFPIEDVDVAVTIAATVVRLSLPEDARVDEEMTSSIFNPDEF